MPIICYKNLMVGKNELFGKDHTHTNLCNNLHWVSTVNKRSQFDGEDCLFSIQNPLKISLVCFCTVYEFLDVDLPFRFNVDLKNFLGLGTVSLPFWIIMHKLKDTNKMKPTISTTKNHSNCDPTKCCNLSFLHMLREALWEIKTLLMLHCSFITPYWVRYFHVMWEMKAQCRVYLNLVRSV